MMLSVSITAATSGFATFQHTLTLKAIACHGLTSDGSREARTDLHASSGKVRTVLETSIGKVRSDLELTYAKLCGRIDFAVAELSARVAESGNQTARWTIGPVIAVVAVPSLGQEASGAEA